MTYRIEFSPSAVRDIKKLSVEVAADVVKLVKSLADDPRPDGVKKLRGFPDCYRVRSGVYRIVYVIEDNIVKVSIVTVGHRREVYQGLRDKIGRKSV